MNDQAQGGLRLPGALDGVGETDAEEIHVQWAIASEIDTYLEMELGMGPPQEPDYPCPTLDIGNLTAADNRGYTERYAQYVAWIGFLSERKAKHDGRLLEIEQEMLSIKTRIRKKMRELNRKTTAKGIEKDPALAVMEDAINSNPRYIELREEKLRHTEISDRIHERIENLDNQAKLYSRQIELKRLEFEQGNRSSNIQGRGGLPAPGMRRPTYGSGG